MKKEKKPEKKVKVRKRVKKSIKKGRAKKAYVPEPDSCLRPKRFLKLK